MTCGLLSRRGDELTFVQTIRTDRGAALSNYLAHINVPYFLLQAIDRNAQLLFVFEWVYRPSDCECAGLGESVAVR